VEHFELEDQKDHARAMGARAWRRSGPKVSAGSYPELIALIKSDKPSEIRDGMLLITTSLGMTTLPENIARKLPPAKRLAVSLAGAQMGLMLIKGRARKAPAIPGAEPSMRGVVSGTRGAQAAANRLRHEAALDDFIHWAEKYGYDILGRDVSVRTPFGNRKYDVVIQDKVTRAKSAVELKSTPGAMTRWDAPARHQFAADRWVNEYGADAIGKNKSIGLIEDTIKLLWK